MEDEIVGIDLDRLNDLEKLQGRWLRKLANADKDGWGMWARGVLFGIEIGRVRIAEYNGRSLAELDVLFSEWEKIGTHHEASLVEQTIRGLDFGIRLVIGRVRHFGNAGFEGPNKNTGRPEPPASAKTSKRRSGHKRKPSSRA